MYRRFKIFLLLVVLVVGGYAVAGRFGLSSNGASPEFKDARLQAAIVAQDIVNLSNEMSADIVQVNELDQANEYTDALNITMATLKKSEDLRNRAIELSAELEKMTGALATIDDADARQAALESISNRLALIGRLLSYNDYFVELLTALRVRFTGGLSSKSVATLVNQINAEVTAINNFNRLAGQAMDRFDGLVQSEE